MSGLEKLILGIGMVGFAAGFIVQFQLKKHVSLEKIKAETDPSEIFKNGIPPKKYLTERGEKLHKVFLGGGVVFIGSIVLLILIGTSK